MGCDIHMRAEFRKDGKWQPVGKVFKNSFFARHGITESGYDWGGEFIASPYQDRNYNLFAILGNVRNGSGFAGIKTGDGFNFIDENRGLPSDMATHFDDDGESSPDWLFGDHSYNWLTLEELDHFDWEQTTRHIGVVDMVERRAMLKENRDRPNEWCGSVCGTKVRNISLADMDAEILASEANPEYTYAPVTWESTYRESVGPWWFEETLPALRKIATDNEVKAKDVRIVFGFDS